MTAATEKPPKSSSSEKGKAEKHGDPRAPRFNSTVLVLISLGILQLIVAWFMGHVSLLVAKLLILVMCAFAHEWNWVHGDALTRHHRAYLNVANVLETYQPRARTEGHLFQPEPPTPGYLAVTESSNDTEGEGEEKKEFMNARDAHYAGMYTTAVQKNKEAEMMTRNALENSSLDQIGDVKLVPADPEKDKKEAEEKKKKATEEYLKQFEKPFSC
ncbi:unnamed protein product [Cylicocyclus nassatus]|uniref:Uncharacterized protein n=1 Tax=Cylicocyclus nassatus TaxID=53992 RepID=A0AA36GZG7_CYLNA|nr:unnamed protein product [Cylicocyclus nassatus]